LAGGTLEDFARSKGKPKKKHPIRRIDTVRADFTRNLAKVQKSAQEYQNKGDECKMRKERTVSGLQS
jgi:hypothetical protein